MPFKNHTSSTKVTRRKKKLNPSPVHKVLENFANRTTMHGVPRIIHAESLHARIFWSIICIAAFGMFLWQCAILLNRYYSFPKKVNVEIIQRPVQFPSVTICNADHLNLIMVDLLEKITSENHTELKEIKKLTDPVQIRFRDAYQKFWTESTNFFMSLTSVQHEEIDKSMLHTYSRLGLTDNLGADLASEAGVKLEDFIFNCAFMGKACNISEVFHEYFHSYYYNCFTFDPKIILQNRTSRLQGIGYGFSVMLFTASAGQMSGSSGDGRTIIPGLQEADSALSTGRGARIVIHPQDTEPHPTAEGYDIPPGFSATIGIKARENVRINHPHGNCTKESNVTGEYKYTLFGCQYDCLQRKIMEECGCVDNSLPNPVDDWGLPFCYKIPDLPSECVFSNSTMGFGGGGEDFEYMDYSDPSMYPKGEMEQQGGGTDAHYEEGSGSPHTDPSYNPHSDPSMYGHGEMMNNTGGMLPSLPPQCLKIAREWLNRTKCRGEVFDMMAINDPASIDRCGCYPSCNDITYSGSYSISLLPEQSEEHNWFYAHIKRFLGTLGPTKSKLIERKYRKVFQENLPSYIARVNVHIADSNVIKTSESPDYESFRLISDIGGQLGLWIGISVMTLFEVVQLVADVVHFISKPKKQTVYHNHSEHSENELDMRYETDRLTAL